jgi:uncharacterized membrane protein
VSKSEGESGRPKKESPATAYTQINFLFPQSSVELPSADKFKEFPPEAQKVILETFKLEQHHRHQWITTQQTNNHAINMLRQKHAFWNQISNRVAGVVLVLAAFVCGLLLIQMGQTIWGVGCFIVSVAILIGTAVYGHKARSAPIQESQPDAQPVETEKLPQK